MIFNQIKLKRNIFFVALFTFFSLSSKSQNNFSLPSGYHTSKDYYGKEYRADGDFDGDGINDLAILCADKKDNKIIVVYLASAWLVDKSYWWFPWDYYSNLSFSNNVLTIDGGDGTFLNMVLKLKYYPKLNNMKLIGYEQEEYVRAAEGGGMVKVSSKSINLNTGEYQVNGGVKRKINIQTITLSNIEKYFEYLSQVGTN
jgi:hypothetical protein